MLKPNFLIIGAPKCGTTSLYNYLQQHPDIEFPNMKEPKYFSFDSANLRNDDKLIQRINKFTIKTQIEYLELFKDLNASNVGEASPNYLHSKIAPKRIFRFNPDMKLILILRNPMDRAYSDWKHNIRNNMEPEKTFRKALNLISIRKEEGVLPYSDYLIKGMYAEHIDQYLKFFSLNQMFILFFDDLVKNPIFSCNEIIKFLGISSEFEFNTSKIFMDNEVSPRNLNLYSFSKRISVYIPALSNTINKINRIGEMKLEDRLFLKEYYKQEILRLQNITGRNLDSWLEV